MTVSWNTALIMTGDPTRRHESIWPPLGECWNYSFAEYHQPIPINSRQFLLLYIQFHFLNYHKPFPWIALIFLSLIRTDRRSLARSGLLGGTGQLTTGHFGQGSQNKGSFQRLLRLHAEYNGPGQEDEKEKEREENSEKDFLGVESFVSRAFIKISTNKLSLLICKTSCIQWALILL